MLNTTDTRMLKVYDDFGDVRYDGCRHLAFTQWWTERVNTTEQRGAYLFAEPVESAAVSVIHNEDDAAAALGSEHTLVLAVDLHSQRKYIDGWVDRLLQRHMGKLKRGRQVRNPKFSAARYRLAKAVQAAALKKTFAVHDIRTAALANGQKITNWEVAQQAKLDYRQREKDESALEGPEERRVVSAIVARHMKHAKAMIENAAVGVFP